MAKGAFGMVAGPGGGMEHMDEEEPDEAMDAEEGAEEDDGDEAAARTALSDFASALGIKLKNPDAALAAFKDLMEHC